MPINNLWVICCKAVNRKDNLVYKIVALLSEIEIVFAIILWANLCQYEVGKKKKKKEERPVLTYSGRPSMNHESAKFARSERAATVRESCIAPAEYQLV